MKYREGSGPRLEREPSLRRALGSVASAAVMLGLLYVCAIMLGIL